MVVVVVVGGIVRVGVVSVVSDAGWLVGFGGLSLLVIQMVSQLTGMITAAATGAIIAAAT